METENFTGGCFEDSKGDMVRRELTIVAKDKDSAAQETDCLSDILPREVSEFE